MKTVKILTILLLALTLLAWQPEISNAEPIGSAWTYQGRLMDTNDPADGIYDFEFKLFDAPNGGVQEGNTIDVNDLDVINGYFTVELDFGSGVFDGDARWLAIGVRPGDSNNLDPFVTLSPRQEVVSTPYSLYARNAGADNDWIISGSGMYSVPDMVGIGTTDPGMTSLFVQRPSSSPPFGILQDGLVIKNGQTCLGNQLEIQDSSGNTEFVVTGPRVGIGTTNPGAKLEVNGGNNEAGLRVAWGSDYPNLYGEFKHAHSEGLIINANAGGEWADMSLQTDGKTRMFIESSGNVGIGTTTPDYELEVNGSMGTSADASSKLHVGRHSAAFPNSYISATGGADQMRLQIGSSTKMVIAGNGNVGLGTTNPWAGLHLKGAGYPSSFMYLQSNSGQDAGIRLYEGDTEKWHIFNSSSDGGLMICNNAYSPVLFADQSTGNVRVRVLEITGGDLVEGFDTGDDTCKPGTVMVIDSKNPGQLAPSTTAYDRKVAGVVSGAGDVSHGIQMGKQEGLDGDTLVAMTGRVYCLADASNGEIIPGDLLTTSHTAGHAMKVTDHDRANGAILGKAMSRLEAGKKGLVLVLVALQ